MQTINLGFCSILQTPPIFADVIATVGDANGTTIIKPTIPAQYASCQFSVSLTAIKNGVAYNPRPIIGFVD
jgi:hypothetical protein